ncbi:MAG: DUF5685 family protein [Bacillota bacterium]|nr:DUF5685 family protein [Bacillota bacterium]
MFGYAVANIDKLTNEEMEQYRSCYCGICKVLRERYGIISRFTLTYDMAFLVLLLTSFFKLDRRFGKERCPAHPFKPHRYWANETTDYAADINVLLAYYNLLDNWQDEHQFLSLWGAKLLESKANVIKGKYSRKSAAIVACLDNLSAMEKRGETNPDLPGNCFGEMMGEIIIHTNDHDDKNLRSFGVSLGKFIYIMDAAIDLEKDLKHESYNPLMAYSSEDFDEILHLLIGDCVEKYGQLELNSDQGLLENILYSGIWTRYQAAENKRKKGSRKN